MNRAHNARRAPFASLAAMDTLFRDLRFAARQLLKSPAFTAVVLLTLTLGIGANTAIFSVVNAMLLQPLPYRDADRLVMIWQDWRARGGPATEWFNLPDFWDWREQNSTFDEMAAIGGWAPSLTGSGEPERLQGQQVTRGFFEVLGTAATVGRTFAPSDETPGAGRTVVLSHGLWQRRFAGDPRLVGAPIMLNGEPHVVIGVAPPTFRSPIEPDAQLWRVIIRDPAAAGCFTSRGCVTLQAIGRLKAGVPIERAQADVATIAARLAEQYPQSNTGRGANLVSLQEQLTGDARPALVTLLGAVAFVLLIACANIANLLLARGAGRAREVAIRTALGAHRGRLVRQLLTEALVLAAAGGVLGLVAAVWGVEALVRLIPPEMTELFSIGISAPVLLFTVVITVLAGVVFGLVPAVRSTRTDLAETFKEGGRSASGGAGAKRLRGALVVSEVAIALLLLVGAGLMMRSFVRLQGVQPGFDPQNLLTARVSLPANDYPGDTAVRVFYDQLLERLARLPGVRGAAGTSVLPFGGSNTDVSIMIEGRATPPPGQAPTVWYRQVTPGYLSSMGIPLRGGRDFSDADRHGGVPVVIVNETAASRFWPGESALGKRIRLGGDPSAPWAEVVGIAGDVRHSSLELPPTAEMYLSFTQYPSRSLTLVLRADEGAERLVAPLRAELSRLDPALPLSDARTMESRLSASLALPRLYMLLLSIFSAVALVLAAVGIYGTMAYSVAQRTHEIGIRMALGARARDVLRLVVVEAGVLAAIGIAAGLVAAVLATRVMRSILYEVSATDPATFAGVAVLLGGVAIVASWLPARRATRVDPVVAFRAVE